MRTSWLPATAALVVLILTGAATGDPGDLDPLFGMPALGSWGVASTGISLIGTPALPYPEYSRCSVAVLPDGTLALAGHDFLMGQSFVARFTSTGIPDSTFGGDGIAHAGTPAHLVAPHRVDVDFQSDGKVLLAFVENPTSDISYSYLTRFNTDGSQDVSFNNGNLRELGILSLLPGVPDPSPGVAIEALPDGKIVTASLWAIGSDYVFLDIRRFNEDGTSDPTFISWGGDSTEDAYTALALESDTAGGILLAESAPDGSYIARLESTGALDVAFGANGVTWLTDHASPGCTKDIDITCCTDGSILVAGIRDSLPFLTRLNASGSLDADFGDNGEIVLEGPSTGEVAVVEQADSKILLCAPRLGTEGEIVLARYDADGVPDSTFGTGGVARYNQALNGFHRPTGAVDIAVLEDGGIVMGGYEDSIEGYALLGVIPDSSVVAPDAELEPPYTLGLENTVGWSLTAYDYIVQCAEDSFFSVGLQEAVWAEINPWIPLEHTFTGLVDGRGYYYRMRGRITNSLSEWSESVFSIQDDTPPWSQADALPETLLSTDFIIDVPFTADDTSGGVADVEMFWAHLGAPPGEPIQFGWEDSTSTHLGCDGSTLEFIEATNVDAQAHSGSRSLQLLDAFSAVPAPASYVAWVRNLQPDDEVTAGFWRYDASSGYPDVLIRGRWNDDPDDIDQDDGDAGVNTDDGPETGWDYTEFTWTNDAGHTGLVIEAYMSSSLFNGGGTVWIDDLSITAPQHATVTTPDTVVYGAYFSLGTSATSPFSVDVGSEGTYGFFTMATDMVGHVEAPPFPAPDACTTVVEITTGVEGGSAPLVRTALRQSFPNPFNPSTTIGYYLAEPREVTLRIYDVSGRLVRTLRDGVHEEVGSHSVVWRGRDDEDRPLPSGVYFCRLEAGSESGMRRMVLLK